MIAKIFIAPHLVKATCMLLIFDDNSRGSIQLKLAAGTKYALSAALCMTLTTISLALRWWFPLPNYLCHRTSEM